MNSPVTEQKGSSIGSEAGDVTAGKSGYPQVGKAEAQGSAETPQVGMTPQERLEAVAEMQRLAAVHRAAMAGTACPYCAARVGEAHGSPCIEAIQKRKERATR